MHSSFLASLSALGIYIYIIYIYRLLEYEMRLSEVIQLLQKEEAQNLKIGNIFSTTQGGVFR